MNQINKAHPFAEILHALADRKQIQHKFQERAKWVDSTEEDVGFLIANRTTAIFRVKPETRIGWINIYPMIEEQTGLGSYVYATQEEANKAASTTSSRIACIQITYTPGEGIES